jgi:nucleotide-binding universal stress UspA family protein
MMTTTQRVLVPLDGSRLAERAIPVAAALARPGGSITFMHVVPDPEPLRGIFGSMLATADDVLSMERETAYALMEETAGRWKDVLGQEPGILVKPGDPAEVILKGANDVGATMIAIASHGRGMAGRVAFGSVADRIARSSDVPVLIVHPDDEQDNVEIPPKAVKINRILVPLDGSETSAEALPLATALAQALGATLHLVQAVNPSAMLLPSPVGAAHYPAELYQEVATELSTAAKETLTQAQSDVSTSGVDTTQVVVEGPAVAAIESEARDSDLIVMTSHGRGGFRRWLLGSVAEKLIRSGVAPVVLVPSAERVAAGSQGG